MLVRDLKVPQISASTTSEGSAYKAGLIAAIPLAIPGVPFGFILGIAIAEAPIDGIIGWGGSWFLFGGAAQLTMTTLLGEGAVATAAVVAALVVNARHLMYSMAMATRFQNQPTWFRWFGPHLLVDQVFALTDLRRELVGTEFRHYYLGAATTMLAPWTTWVALGITVGAQVPEAWNLAFAVPVLFLGLAILGMRNLPGVVAAAVTISFSGLANRAGILVGALVAVAVAAFVPESKPESTS